MFGRVRDFLEEGFKGARGVWRLRNGPADDEQGSACAERVRRCRNTSLIAGCRTGGSDAGHHKQGAGAEFNAQQCRLFGRADDAIQTRFTGQTRESQDLRGGCVGNPNAGELRLIHAGQDGDGDQAGAARRLARGFSGCLQHGFAARGMHCEEGRTGVCQGAHRARHGIGNVVQFQVEEDAQITRGELLNDAWAGGQVKLKPDLDPAALPFEAIQQGKRVARGGQIERQGDSLLCVGKSRLAHGLSVPSHLTARPLWTGRGRREAALSPFLHSMLIDWSGA